MYSNSDTINLVDNDPPNKRIEEAKETREKTHRVPFFFPEQRE